MNPRIVMNGLLSALLVASLAFSLGAAAAQSQDKELAVLLRATEAVDVKRIETLLKLGASPNVKTVEEWTPLHLLARSHEGCGEHNTLAFADVVHYDIRKWRTGPYTRGIGAAVRLLLEHGADLDSRDIRGETPLDAALDRYHLQFVAQLLPHVDVSTWGEVQQFDLWRNSLDGIYGVDFGQYWEDRFKHDELVFLAKSLVKPQRLLGGAGLNVNARAADGRTPFMEVVKAAAGSRNSFGRGSSSVHYGDYWAEELVDYFIKQGADIQAVARDGSTALSIALETDAPQWLLDRLIKEGASLR